jgi:hypothetical protein
MRVSTLRYLTDKLKSTPIVWVLAAGLALRIYSAAMRCIINPDGTLYIYQAGKIIHGQWSELLTCKLAYLSPLPLFISIAFGLCRDWIAAAQSVNILFGWAVLFPLYFILRRYLDNTAATFTVLIYALMPLLVEGSANVIRGPIFWFCMAMGILTFIRQWDEKAPSGRFRLDLLLSGLFFLLGAWARIEGAAFLAVSPLYLLIARGDKKLQKILIFLSPLILCGLIAAGVAFHSKKDDVTATTRVDQIFHEVTQFADQYDSLNDQIKDAARQYGGLFGSFLERSRETLAFIPLAAIFYHILEGVFYPFALVFFIGFSGLSGLFRQHPRSGYLFLLSAAGFVVLYVHMLQTWVIDYRFLAIMMFPACIIMANGVRRVMGYLRQTRSMSPRKAVTLFAAFLILFGLPKSLKPEEQDKIVFRQAAQAIEESRDADQLVRVGTANASRAFEWVLLYAHRHSPDLYCALHMVDAVPDTYEQFKANLDKSGNRYFFYEENHWPATGFDLLAAPYQNDFRLLGQWRHPDSGLFAVFQRLN